METEQGIRKTPTVKIDREEINYSFTDNAECPSKDCLECKNLTSCKTETKIHSILYVMMPQYIIDNHMNRLSLSAWKVFIYLNRRAHFGYDENKFGTCWFTFKQVEKATGVKVSNMRKYIKELIREGLITGNYLVANRKGECKTVHNATIKWFKLHRKLELKFAQSQPIKML